MCRSIKPLRNMDHHATHDEIHEAALQYVRKVSGYRKPSKVNQAAFDAAVVEVADATHKMLHNLITNLSARAALEAIYEKPSQQ